MKLAGIILSWLVALFMVADAIMKFIRLPLMVEALENLGYQESDFNTIGLLGLLAAVLYVIPRTAVPGLFLITGYLGGAIASNFRTDASPTSHLYFAVLILLLTWAGALLRYQELRSMFFRKRL
ncbi:MAG: DoxX family protein [Candidatus Cyclobacteriaceae bacterium M2_1C_046]